MYYRKKVIMFQNIMSMSVEDLDVDNNSAEAAASSPPNLHLERRKSGGFFSTKSEIGRETIELKVTKDKDGKLIDKAYRCVDQQRLFPKKEIFFFFLTLESTLAINT